MTIVTPDFGKYDASWSTQTPARFTCNECGRTIPAHNEPFIKPIGWYMFVDNHGQEVFVCNRHKVSLMVAT